MSKAHGPLADRPINPKVGLEISHESAGLHVTGKALYTQDLVNRTKDTLHAWPVQAPHAHALVTGLRVDPAYDVPGVIRVLTADDVPGLNDAGEKHDEPLFPSEVMFYGHAVCWVHCRQCSQTSCVTFMCVLVGRKPCFLASLRSSRPLRRWKVMPHSLSAITTFTPSFRIVFSITL